MQKEKRSVRSKNKDKFYEDLVKSVEADFSARRNERLRLERQWELNMNFLIGNQYCGINGRGEIVNENSDFYWQKREVFNHIAPVIETRLAKYSDIPARASNVRGELQKYIAGDNYVLGAVYIDKIKDSMYSYKSPLLSRSVKSSLSIPSMIFASLSGAEIWNVASFIKRV